MEVSQVDWFGVLWQKRVRCLRLTADWQSNPDADRLDERHGCLNDDLSAGPRLGAGKNVRFHRFGGAERGKCFANKLMLLEELFSK